MTKEQVNAKFDKEIERLIIDKKLFNLTFYFSIADWKNIRTNYYWEKIDSLPEIEKKKYTLKCVEYYINKYINDK